MFYETLITALVNGLFFVPVAGLYVTTGWIMFHMLKANTHSDDVGFWMYAVAVFWPVTTLAMTGVIIHAAIWAIREDKI